MSCDLYRFWNADGVLIYIGISLSAIQRLSQHKNDKSWETEISTVTIERFDDRDHALKAEKRAIMTEAPKYNITHNKPKPIYHKRPTTNVRHLAVVTRKTGWCHYIEDAPHYEELSNYVSLHPEWCMPGYIEYDGDTHTNIKEEILGAVQDKSIAGRMNQGHFICTFPKLKEFLSIWGEFKKIKKCPTPKDDRLIFHDDEYIPLDTTYGWSMTIHNTFHKHGNMENIVGQND